MNNIILEKGDQNDASQVEYGVAGAINLRNQYNLPYSGKEILDWWEKNQSKFKNEDYKKLGIDGVNLEKILDKTKRVKSDIIRGIDGMYSFSKNWSNAYRSGGDHSIGKGDIVASLDNTPKSISIKSQDAHKWGKFSSLDTTKKDFIGLFKLLGKYFPDELENLVKKSNLEKKELIKNLRNFTEKVKQEVLQDNTEVVKTLDKFNSQVKDSIENVGNKKSFYLKLLEKNILTQDDFIDLDALSKVKKVKSPKEVLTKSGIEKLLNLYLNKFVPEILTPGIKQELENKIYPRWSEISRTYINEFKKNLELIISNPKFKEILLWNLITDEGKGNKLDFMLRDGKFYDLGAGFKELRNQDWFQDLVKRTNLARITQPKSSVPYNRIKTQFKNYLEKSLIDNKDLITKVGKNLLIQNVYTQFQVNPPKKKDVKEGVDFEETQFDNLLGNITDDLISNLEDKNPLSLFLNLSDFSGEKSE